jgi:hypothetical protein
MGRESAIDRLKPEDKDWLDNRFRDQGFCGYEEIAKILQERGYDIGKSSVHRYGQAFEQKLENVQASTEAAMMMQKLSPDDGGNLSGAVLSMIQSGFFDCLVALQQINGEESAEKRLALLSKVSVGISKIADSSVNQKKWLVTIRMQVEQAAKEVEKIVKKGGLSKETAAEIRKQILGIASE